ncbi:hypothetical protein ACFL96_07705 [Thermoproteota archaeon]
MRQENISRKQRKAQVWYTDFFIGLLIFIVAMTGYLAYTYSDSVEEKGELSELIIDAKVIASSLISEGYPSDWNESNVTRIGLTDGDYRLMEEKLDAFNDLSYDDRADLLGTTKDYYFYIQYQNGTEFNHLGMNGSSAVKLVQMTRIVVYNDTFVKMVFYLWQN